MTLQRTRSDLANQVYALTLAEIELRRCVPAREKKMVVG
jgi:hypothetical protein